jgi:hypothetical protein
MSLISTQALASSGRSQGLAPSSSAAAALAATAAAGGLSSDDRGVSSSVTRSAAAGFTPSLLSNETAWEVIKARHTLMEGVRVGAEAQGLEGPMDPVALVNTRQNLQSGRIENGTESGALTEQELGELARGQTRIEHFTEVAMNDGEMSQVELIQAWSLLGRQASKIAVAVHGDLAGELPEGTVKAAVEARNALADMIRDRAQEQGLEGPMDASSVVNLRQEVQQLRIEQGIESGALTQQEADALASGQERIQRIEDDAIADGDLSQAELIKTWSLLMQQGSKISVALNNGASAPLEGDPTEA